MVSTVTAMASAARKRLPSIVRLAILLTRINVRHLCSVKAYFKRLGSYGNNC